VFIQSTNAGRTTLLPASRFKTLSALDENNVLLNGKLDNKDLNLKQIQVSYGSVTKPATLYESGFGLNNEPAGLVGSLDDRMVQRWISTHNHIGDLHKGGPGIETYSDWLKRGPYYHLDYSRDKNDTSTQAKVQIQYQDAFTTDVQLFLVAHYTRSISIDYNQGHIQQVTSVNR